MARPEVEGRIEHHGRFAFVVLDDSRAEDVFIQGPTLRLARDGDRVRVRVRTERRGERPLGEIVEVLTRSKSTVVGVYGRGAVVPERDPADTGYEVLGIKTSRRPREGDLVVLKISRWPEMHRSGAGFVTECLGRPDAPGVRVRVALRSRELPERFSDAALRETEGMPRAVEPEHWKGRETLFHLPVFTIDGADAKDFDDAVSLERLKDGGARLGVHIADVSHYVMPGSPLDRDAYERATSVYLADRVVPMLPPRISDDLCSLRPDVHRLTVSAFITYHADGRVEKTRFARTVIKSCRRFTYEEVEDVLRGRPVERVAPEVRAVVQSMGEWALKLRKRRFARGALDFDLPEFRVVVDAKGVPVDVLRRDRLESHRLIEDFMLAANEAVALKLNAARKPFLWRVHEFPDPEKLEALGIEVRELGIETPRNLHATDGKGVRALLDAVRGHPLESMIHYLTVRSLKQARYSPLRGDGHFGLSSAFYCHFTSPIRRYPDLIVHRALCALLENRRSKLTPGGVDLAAAGDHCSERERVAATAERESVAALRAQLLGGRVGEVFDGVVTGRANSGAFVELTSVGGAGLLRGQFPPLGTRIKVRLDSVDTVKGEFDVSLWPGTGQGFRGAMRLRRGGHRRKKR